MLKIVKEERGGRSATMYALPERATDVSFTAIQEELGLRPEAEKAEVPVFVIDRVEHPTPN